jgi:hypothetical protein
MAPEHFRLTPFGKPLWRDVPRSVWSAVIFWPRERILDLQNSHGARTN